MLSPLPPTEMQGILVPARVPAAYSGTIGDAGRRADVKFSIYDSVVAKKGK